MCVFCDMRNVPKLVAKLKELNPEAMAAFEAMNAAAFKKDGPIPPLYAELIALGFASARQCSVCIRYHRDEAIKANATPKQLAQLAAIEMAMGAGAAFAHSMFLFLRDETP